MKNPGLFLLTTIVFPGFLAAAEPALPPMTAAAFDVECVSPALKDRAGQFSALFQAELAAQPNLAMVERAQLDTAVGELSLSASGMADPSTAAKVGRLTGAKALILSKAIGSPTEMTVVAKIIGSETGRVFAVTETIGSSDTPSAAKALAGKVAALAKTHATELLAPAEDTAAREAKMKALVAGKNLQTITISIPEQHITRPVRDPAAETEIARTLGGLGFSIFGQSSAEKAAIRITGEAISELGTRHGDFISCRARVEIKVVDTASGKILLQDRQTEVVADISEAIAAKTALQNAGGKLAERIVAVLVTAQK
jgi:hypothetical protein